MATSMGCGRDQCSGVGRAGWLGLQLSADQQKELAEVLDQGPVKHGWQDARLTLARVAEVIERRFAITYTTTFGAGHPV